ncbi:hypothetical protein CTI12_AA402300 [Artemisia annua]|uniref:Uncharacterized protein n=1 Tax=Artemisia annua TaxID=35608 RepID=A0A2U1M5C8_ARTAN|nr:hypothetical protein CTI12_AA402300 [Artemisia annua]
MKSVSADVVNACDASDGVAEDSVSADVVNAFDALDGVVEEFFSADVVNASDSSDLLINYVSSSSDVVAVSNDDQNASSIEVHATRLYTRSLFVRVQKEIIAGSWLCSIKSKISEEGSDICIISEEIIIPDSMPDATEFNKAEDLDDEVEEIDLYKKSTREYKVLHNRSGDSVVCCCQLFRWTRDLIPPGLRRKKNRYGRKDANVDEEEEEEAAKKKKKATPNRKRKETESPSATTRSVAKKQRLEEEEAKENKIKNKKKKKQIEAIMVLEKEKTKKEVENKKRKRVENEKKEVEKEKKSLRTKTTVKPFYEAIHSLSPERKQRVREMGFGTLLGFPYIKFPAKLPYFILKHLDVNTMEVKLPNGGFIEITPSKIREALGIPMGPMSFCAENKRLKSNSVHCKLMEQLSRDVRKRTTSSLSKIIQTSEGTDFIFYLNFLMLFANCIGTCRNTAMLKYHITKKEVENKKRKRGENEKKEVEKEKKVVKRKSLRTKTTVKPFYEAIHSLSPERKQRVREMDFGTLLGFPYIKFPAKLPYFILKHLDVNTMEVKLPNGGVIEITPSKIREVLGIPMGLMSFYVENKRLKSNSVHCKFMAQLSRDVRKRTTSSLSEIIQTSEGTDIIFDLNFLMLFANCLGTCRNTAMLKYHVLENVMSSKDIPNIDWCVFIWNCIKESKQKWDDTMLENWYYGPHVTFTNVASRNEAWFIFILDPQNLYADWKFHYSYVRRQVGGITMAVYEAILSRETSTNYPLVNFFMATKADLFIGALGSTWCFLIYGMRNAGGKVMVGTQDRIVGRGQELSFDNAQRGPGNIAQHGSGRSRARPQKVSAEYLDADLEKYHLKRMHIK